MDLKERLSNFISYLGINTKTFQLNVGLSNGFVSHIGDAIRKKSLDLILAKYPELNKNWLLTGDGQMIKGLASSAHDYDVKYERPNQKTGRKSQNLIPVYDGNIEGEVAYEVDIPQFRDCNFGKIIHDNAMQPGIQNGECVFLKVVTDKLLIIPGKTYYIKFDNYEIVRRLHKIEENEVLAVADNTETRPDGSRVYENFSIPIEKIKELYQVKGLLKQNLN